jgi:hypothetical protein
MTTDIVIASAARTPVGSLNGAFFRIHCRLTTMSGPTN